VKGARKRYRQSRARTDKSDGELIANLENVRKIV